MNKKPKPPACPVCGSDKNVRRDALYAHETLESMRQKGHVIQGWHCHSCKIIF